MGEREKQNEQLCGKSSVFNVYKREMKLENECEWKDSARLSEQSYLLLRQEREREKEGHVNGHQRMKE